MLVCVYIVIAFPRIIPAEIPRYCLLPMSVSLISRQPMKLQISFGFARAMSTPNPRTGMLWERDWSSPCFTTCLSLQIHIELTVSTLLCSSAMLRRHCGCYPLSSTNISGVRAPDRKVSVKTWRILRHKSSILMMLITDHGSSVCGRRNQPPPPLIF